VDGADVEQKSGYGATALGLAARSGYAACVQRLLEAKADPKATGAKGATCLHYAAEGGNEGVVLALLEAGADPSATAGHGSTPLHKTAWEGHAAVVRALITAGANVAARDMIGCTPLHAASANGCVDAVRELLRLGADPAIRDNEGATPLDDALAGRVSQWEEVVHLLGGEIPAQQDPHQGELAEQRSYLAPPAETEVNAAAMVAAAMSSAGAALSPTPRPPDQGNVITLADKVAAIKKELGLDEALTAIDAITEANAQMGMVSEGSLPAQASKLIAALELG